MSIPAFTQGYPPDGSSLGQTKSTIRDNLDGTFLTLAVDHINNNGQPGMQPAGYHTIIHQVPQTNVSTVTGYNQIFSAIPKNVVINGSSITNPVPNNTDTQLFTLSSAGNLAQLTGYNISMSQGYAWMGGILVQWGNFSTSGNNTGMVNFNSSPNVTFPKNCFGAFLQISGIQANKDPFTYSVNSLATTGFTWTSNRIVTQTMYWIAIGN